MGDGMGAFSADVMEGNVQIDQELGRRQRFHKNTVSASALITRL
jgi:hypothetical protein